MGNQLTDIFNRDIEDAGSYAYTNKSIYSAYIATKKQSDEIVKIIKKFCSSHLTILDVGCGDGTFTLELLERVSPAKIVGFDIAQKAIEKAKLKITKETYGKLEFKVCSVNQVENFFYGSSYDLVIVRGVVHHLENPEELIRQLSGFIPNILILEPNGYNPILKIIERTSPYHISHQEKSYAPQFINRMFEGYGYRIRFHKFFGIVPYFCKPYIARALKIVGPVVEKIPFFKRFLCGTYIVLFKK